MRTHLPAKVHVAAVLALCLFALAQGKLFAMALVLYGSSIWFFRKSARPPLNDHIRAPLNGYVAAVEGNRIQMAIPWWGEFSLRLPVRCEVASLTPSKHKLVLQCENGDPVELRFFQNRLGLWPQTDLMPGDRGLAGALIGYFPWGGTVFLSLPAKYEILVATKQQIRAGQTIVAKSGGP